MVHDQNNIARENMADDRLANIEVVNCQSADLATGADNSHTDVGAPNDSIISETGLHINTVTNASVDTTLKQAAQRVADMEGRESPQRLFRKRSAAMMSCSGNQSVGGTTSSSVESPVRMVRSRSVLGRLPSYAQPTVSSLLRASRSNDLLEGNALPGQGCPRCRPRSVSPVMNKSKDHRGRSKTGRLSSTPRRHHGGTTESLSASVTSTPALIHSPRPRSANRTEINSALSTPRSGARSEVNSTVSTPVLLNSPAKSSNVGRSLVTSVVKDKPILATKDSKPPSGVADGDLKTCISKPRRKQSNEMSKSFELHLQTDFTVDGLAVEKKMNKSLSARSTSSSQDIQAKFSSKENLEVLKSKSIATDDSRSKQKTFSENGRVLSKSKDSSTDMSSVKEDGKLKSVKEDTKAKMNLSVDDKTKPRLQSAQVKAATADTKKPTGDDKKPAVEEDKKKMPKKTMGTKSSVEEEKLKSKIQTDKDKVKQSIDEEKRMNVCDEKEKVELSEKDKLKQGSPTSSQVKPKPSTINKSGHDEAKKKHPSETLRDAKSDSNASDKEIKKNGLPESKKEKNVDTKMRVDTEKSETDSVTDAPVDEYKAKLAENRRLAREKAEREAAEEELRQKKLQQEEEERQRKEEEEERLREAEEMRFAEELRKSEEERLQRAVEEEEKRRKQEQEQLEKEKLQRQEAERLAKEEAARLELERQVRIKREEEEKLERKKRLEMIMKRVKTDDTSPKTENAVVKCNDTVSPEDGTQPASAADVAPSGVMQQSTTEPQFKSARLQQLLGNKMTTTTPVKQDDSVNRSIDQVTVSELELLNTEKMNGNNQNSASEWEAEDSTRLTLTSITNTAAPLLLQETN